MKLCLRNEDLIDEFKEEAKDFLPRFPVAEKRLELWSSRPNWIAVVNIDHLQLALTTIQSYFLSLKTCTSKTALNTKRKVRIE